MFEKEVFQMTKKKKKCFFPKNIDDLSIFHLDAYYCIIIFKNIFIITFYSQLYISKFNVSYNCPFI